MSKQIRRQIAFLLSITMLAATALLSPLRPARAQQHATPVQPPANTRGASVAAATEAVLRETSEIRELPILNRVKSGAQSRSEIERMILKNLEEDTTPEEIHASEVALKKLGLAPADFQLRPFLVKLLTEQVAGYYDPKTQEFYLADWIDLDGQKPVMAHELTHALQDQHFNLRRFEHWPKGDSDAEIAAHALIEGDASLVMQKYLERNPLRALAFVRSMMASGTSMEMFESAPRALRETLMFPYEQGRNWVSALQDRGGWAQVSKAFTDLPQSTEQILHPAKYFAREAPIKIGMADISSQLGADWKRIDTDVNGEWGYYEILSEYLKSGAEAGRASEGWGGDRYSVYENRRTGAIVIAQVTAWDSEQDAVEFYNAYANRTTARYPNSTEASAEGTTRVWQTGEGAALMERRGQRVAILEGAPSSISRNALMKMLWQ